MQNSILLPYYYEGWLKKISYLFTSKVTSARDLISRREIFTAESRIRLQKILNFPRRSNSVANEITVRPVLNIIQYPLNLLWTEKLSVTII